MSVFIPTLHSHSHRFHLTYRKSRVLDKIIIGMVPIIYNVCVCARARDRRIEWALFNPIECCYSTLSTQYHFVIKIAKSQWSNKKKEQNKRTRIHTAWIRMDWHIQNWEMQTYKCWMELNGPGKSNKQFHLKIDNIEEHQLWVNEYIYLNYKVANYQSNKWWYSHACFKHVDWMPKKGWTVGDKCALDYSDKLYRALIHLFGGLFDDPLSLPLPSTHFSFPLSLYFRYSFDCCCCCRCYWACVSLGSYISMINHKDISSLQA